MSDFKWRHFRGDLILGCVRWYCKYGISYREREEMMRERGMTVDHTTIYRWVQHLRPRWKSVYVGTGSRLLAIVGRSMKRILK